MAMATKTTAAMTGKARKTSGWGTIAAWIIENWNDKRFG
jgi:hypothetical protein